MLTQSPVKDIIKKQRQFFATGETKDINFRLQALQRLKQGVLDSQDAVLAALKADLNKPELEAYATEVGVVSDINYAIKNLKAWVKPKKVASSIDQFPSQAYITPEPLGVVLIIAPWNYPFQLMISPLVGAIAAGNCAVIKPSEMAANTSRVVAELIAKIFPPEYVAVVEGDATTAQALLAEKFDHIFFTGGTKIGQIVMEAAAKNLTPVTLELGGKSPCIIDADVNLQYTAKRVVWGKFINAGQTCVAPDYLLVERSIKQDLLGEIKKCVQEFYGDDPAQSPDYGRIINQRQFDRLAGFLNDGEIVVGGQINRENRYIAPTVIDKVSWDMPVMQDEIFGPILPVLEYSNLTEAIAKINEGPKPLALYVFSKNQEKQERVLRETSSGGVCINDTIMHIGVVDLPFGGVGNSGIGAYHGKATFDTFSHYKSILKKSFLLDLKWRYAPYAGKLDLIKKIIG